MRHRQADLIALKDRHGDRLTLRVSLDHHTQAVHEGGSGGHAAGTARWPGLGWLSDEGFSIAVAGRHLGHEPDAMARAGYARLFTEHGIAIDASDPRLGSCCSPKWTRAPMCRRSRPRVGGCSAPRPTASCARPAGWWCTARARPHARVVACTPAALRRRLRPGRNAVRGRPPGVAQPPPLRPLLRARRGELFGVMVLRHSSLPQSGGGGGPLAAREWWEG